MVLDTSLLNTQQYKVRIEGKVEQSWKRSSALPYTLGILVALDYGRQLYFSYYGSLVSDEAMLRRTNNSLLTDWSEKITLRKLIKPSN